MPSQMIFRFSIFCCLIVLFSVAHGGYLPISDGANNFNDVSSSSYLLMEASQNDACEQTYGFMPCTTTWMGNLFLILAYGYLMYVSATFLSTGSEMLLEIMGPGIVGGLFLPMLGALPDAMLILVSGLSGSKAEAQSQVSVGMGLLAGSTVMLLTIVWGVCVLVGKCDIGEADNLAVDGRDTKGFNLTRSGVSADYWTCYAAMIMGISVIPFVVVQLLQLLRSNSGKRIAVLIALVLSVVMLISYCTYQIFQPWIQRRRLAYAKHKHVISKILKHIRKDFGPMLDENGNLERNFVNSLFKTMDTDNDDHLSSFELRAFILGIRWKDIDFNNDDAVSKVMTEFDQSNDKKICPDEFFNGINKWIAEAKRSGEVSSNGGADSNVFNAFHSGTKVDHKLLGGEESVGEESDEVIEKVENPKEIMLKAVGFLLLGTVVAAAFADPLVDVVNNFSSATRIPSFFISFIALPLATNSSEAVSAIIFASRKKLRTASLTFSELYGAVTMNNVLCLSVFLALVYVRGLAWNFSAEVLVILLVCLVMSLFGSFRTTFPIWTCILAFLLYPLSLALVYVLDYVFGWS